jgi:hypothetical protein
LTIGSGGSERVALSRELGGFLIELSIALNRTAMYPQGHPSLDEAAAVVVHHLATLLYDRPSLSIGVARKQLVIEGVATDPRNPVLRSLAERLHGHHIGAVVFEAGAAPQEVLKALQMLARERERDHMPLGLGDPEELRVGPHVRLYPLTYERLELIGDEEDEEPDGSDPGRGSRVAGLWIGLAHAALASEADEPVEPAMTEPAVVARAINEHPAAQAYDQVIVGYLLQIAQELKAEGGAASAAVRKRMSRLVGGLNDDTLQRLVEMGGDREQRTQFMLDAADGLAADAVVDLLRAAAETSQKTVSDSMLRILTKLSAFAEAGTGEAKVKADSALREQIRTLITGWTLEDPNPEQYGSALERMARARAAERGSEGERFPPEPMRVLQMSLEVDSAGPALETAVKQLLDASAVAEIVRCLDASPRGGASELVWSRIADPQRLLQMLAHEPVDFELVDRVVARTDPWRAATVLLDVLVDSDSRDKQQRLMPVLARLGPEAGVEAARRLTDERAVVRRNMLALLNDMETVPTSVSPLAYARDPDPQVRREALQLALRLPVERDRAVSLAVTDSDERVVRIGVRAAQTHLPTAAVALLASRAIDEKLPVDLRVNIVRALAGVESPIVLEALLRLTTDGKTWLGRPKLAARSPVMLAALGVLATRWKKDRRATMVVRRARSAGDADTRSAAGTGS